VANIDVDLAPALRAVIGQLSRRLRPTGAGASLTPTQTSVLFTLVRVGPLPLSELVDLEGLNPTMLSRVIGALAQDGLARRSPDPSDRRGAVVEATAPGRRLRERIHRERNQALRAQLDHLPAEQRESLARALPALEALAEALRRQRA